MALETSGNILADRRLDMARQLAARGAHEEAADLLAQAAELTPGWPLPLFRRGEALMAAGQVADAAESFRLYLALDPADRLGATLKLALLDAAPPPPLPPPAYVRGLFDEYASRFEDALLQKLSYAIPRLLRQAVDQARPPSGKTDRILDLGCGTGLGGEAFADRAARLDGIDLSPAMLAQAARKNIYERLLEGDLLPALQALDGPYDVILAADVLVYFGALETLFSAVPRLLAPHGVFGFSVQKADEAGWRLGADCRYAHSAAYIEKCAQGAGLRVTVMEDAVLRQDAAASVHGLIFVLEKSS